MTTVGIFGASGRMGQALQQALAAAQELQLGAAIVSEHSESRGEATLNGQLHYQSLAEYERQPTPISVWIDFSLPQALSAHLAHATAAQQPILVCTTGLADAAQAELARAAQQIPILYAANTSVGVNVLQHLTKIAARVFADADIEILEYHHQAKRDAPSGTALILGEAAAAGREQSLAEVGAGIRANGVREAGSIGFASVRAGDIIGEHTVLIAHAGERLELTHKVSDRGIFAQGALNAAQWLCSQPSGYYEMSDMLGLG